MNKKHLTLGILAHVDAGKTTLAEGILFQSGSIRTVSYTHLPPNSAGRWYWTEMSC